MGASEVMLIRTTGFGKMVVGIVAGGFFAFLGSGALLFAFGAEGVAILALFLMGTIALLTGGALMIGSVIEALKPTRIYTDGGDLVIAKRRLLGPDKLELIDLTTIQAAIVETKNDTDDDGKPTAWHRIALAMTNGERVSLADYHHIFDLGEARKLAGRVERILAAAKAGDV